MMRQLALVALASATIVGGMALTPMAAFADTSEVVSSATTVENQNCHNPAHTGNTFNTRYMFDGDNITVNYTNCNSNYAYGYSSPYPAYAINYGDVYVNVGMSASAGPTGPVAPTSGANYSVPAQDRQCIKVSATDPGAWGSVSFGLPQWTSTMTSAVTGGYGVYVYDQGPSCGGSSGWNFKQIVYAMAPVVPTVSAAFSDASVAPGTPTDLVITLSNTQILRDGVFQTYTAMGYTLALPAGATAGTASANTCRDSSVSGTTSVILSGGALGGTGNETEGTCTVTVPVTFTTPGSKALTDASITASSTNRGAMFKSVSTSINVTSTPPELSPGSLNLEYYVGTAITPTPAFSTTGLTAPITFSVSPDLPAGLTLNPATGVISGTPEAEQSFVTYTITASDGTFTATAQANIAVAASGGGGGGGSGGSDADGASSGLPDTGMSLRILGVTLGSALMLYIAGVFVFRGRRQLGFAAVNEKVSARMQELDAMLTRMEENARRRRIRRRS
jgi:hypothetical protein